MPMNELSPVGLARRGASLVAGAPVSAKVALTVFLLIFLLMMPFGRSGPDDAGSLLAPLAVDSGVLSRMTPGIDFHAIGEAGRRLLLGEDPYTPATVLTGAPYATPYRYPPTALGLLAVPLGLFPPALGVAVWTALLAFLVLSGFLITVGLRNGDVAISGLLWFCWMPLLPELHMGQFSLFVGWLTFVGLVGWRSGRMGWLAAWGAAGFIKVFPLAMAGLLWNWGQRAWAVGAVGVFLGAVAVAPLVGLGGVRASLAERDLGATWIRGMHAPYAGAQGVPSLVNAVGWMLLGPGTMAPGPDWEAPARSADPVFWANVVLCVGYGALLGGTWWASRRRFSPAAVGVFWLAWFAMYGDVWETHYTMLLPAVAWLFGTGVVGPRMAVAVWIFAGAPSLWWLWQRTGYAGNPVTEAIGLLYFVQRPIGWALLVGACVTSVWQEWKQPDEAE